MIKKILNLPNLLTLSRVLLTPLLLYLLIFENSYNQIVLSLFTILLYTFISLTDYWDGYYARKLNVKSRLGEFLDPLSDKLFTLSVFFVFLYLPYIYLPLWMVLLISFREILITIIRIWAISKNKVMKTERHGKVKTVTQIVSQSVALVVIFNLAIFFELGIIHSSTGYFTDITLSSLFNDMSQNGLEWYFFILKYSPAFFTGITTYYTLISGWQYIYKNIVQKN